MVLKVIIASTIPDSQKLDTRRTAYIYSPEAVEELAKQVEQRHDSGKPVQVLLKSPTRSKDDNTCSILFGDPTKKYEENRFVGELIGATVRPVPEFDTVQCVADMYIYDINVAEGLMDEAARRALCVFPIINYEDREKSLKDIPLSYTDLTDVLSVLQPCFNLIGANIGEKRSSSNPFLSFESE